MKISKRMMLTTIAGAVLATMATADIAAAAEPIKIGMTVSSTGRFALAANQDTHNVVVFRVNQKTGQLTPTGSEIKVFNPVCIRFMETEDDS